MKKQLYKITVNKWSEYNPGRRGSFKKTMISNNFCHDNKLSVLPLSHRWLFLGIILMCGDHNSATVVMSEKQVRALLESSRSASRALDALQSLQLVTYTTDDVGPLLKEVKEVKEENTHFVRKRNTEGVEKLTPPEPKNSDLNKRIWGSYAESYRTRYKVEPARNATVNGQISQLAKRLGEEAVEVVKFYVMHNDTFYVSKAHSIGLCLKDAEGLRTQWARGHQITRAGLKRFENQVGQQELLNAIDRGEV